jgi:site-specific recombinase XerD
MREFVSWVRMRNPHLNIPSLELPEVTTPKRPPRGLTENQIEYLRQVISDLPKGLNKSRLEFCFEFLLHTGLRPNEIAGLTFSHVRGDFLMGVGGKAEHYRDVFLEDEAKSALHIWVKARRELTGTKEEKTGAVLIGRYGAKISYESLRYWFQKLGAKVDGFSMYSLRHTRAIELLERTGDLPLVADQLGHQFVETTMHYLRRSHEQIATRLRLRETPERRGEHPDEPGHRRLFGRDVADIALTLGR